MAAGGAKVGIDVSNEGFSLSSMSTGGLPLPIN
jgi:hypothetical protein